jgi:hypothetical protein
MASQISICNSALIKVGENPIVSITDGTKAANLCAIRFDHARDAVFVKHPWRCLRKRVILAAEVDTPAFDYSHQFRLPTDCLIPYLVTDAGGELYDDYVIEENKILARSAPLYLRYIYRRTDYTGLPDYLAELVALYLAADIGYALTQISTTRDQMLQMFMAELRVARGIDSRSDMPSSIQADDWLASRYWDQPQTYRYRNLV